MVQQMHVPPIEDGAVQPAQISLSFWRLLTLKLPPRNLPPGPLSRSLQTNLVDNIPVKSRKRRSLYPIPRRKDAARISPLGNAKIVTQGRGRASGEGQHDTMDSNAYSIIGREGEQSQPSHQFAHVPKRFQGIPLAYYLYIHRERCDRWRSRRRQKGRKPKRLIEDSDDNGPGSDIYQLKNDGNSQAVFYRGQSKRLFIPDTSTEKNCHCDRYGQLNDEDYDDYEDYDNYSEYDYSDRARNSDYAYDEGHN